jgi:hypothetical protein
MAGRRLGWTVLLAMALLPLSGARTKPPPPHVTWARDLVATVAPEDNLYGAPPDVGWAGVDGDGSWNVSNCSSFLDVLLVKVYGFDLKAWIGSSSPTSARWHDAVVAQNGFRRITDVGATRVGDLVVVKYRDPGESSTGHTMIAVGTPDDQGVLTLDGRSLRRYAVRVLDSDSGYHGHSDTRYLRPDVDGPDTGVGEGTLRIYADPVTDAVAGYSWSDLSTSTFQPQGEEDPTAPGRHLVIGRLR